MKKIFFEFSKRTKINDKLENFNFTSPILSGSEKNNSSENSPKLNHKNRLFRKIKLYSKPTGKSRFLRRIRYNKQATNTNINDS